MTMDAVRALSEALAAKLNVIVALAVPLAGLTVSHEALLAAVHAAEGETVRVNVPLPAADPMAEVPADRLTAACEIVARQNNDSKVRMRRITVKFVV
jgi:hypothetical protein